MTEDRLLQLGLKVDVVLALYRKDMDGRLRKRWTDRTFLPWLEKMLSTAAFPPAARRS